MTTSADPIIELEKAALSRQHSRALAALEALLCRLESSTNQARDGVFDDDARAGMQATRVATATTALLTDPQLVLTPEIYHRLIPFKRQFQAIFEVSGYRGSTLPLRYMSDGVASVRSAQQEQSQLLKMLLVMGLADCSESMLEVVRRLDPSITAPLILSLVASKVALNPTAWKAREKLLGLGPTLESAQLYEHHHPLLAAAWVQCSYAVRPDRHAFKKALNRWMLRNLARSGLDVSPGPPSRGLKVKPRLVVVAEVLQEGHPLYHGDAARIRQLRGRFETILVGRPSDIDRAACGLVDQAMLFPDWITRIDQMAAHVRQLEPDLVYFPSVGLAPWSIALANLRLAPTQLMSPGHPATSASDEMDYLLMSRHGVGDTAAYAERIVICGDGAVHPTSFEPVELPRYRRESADDPVRVAVAADSTKLSWPLVESLRTIAKRTRRPVEWHFFPNECGLIRQHVRVALEDLLRNVHVHPRAPYQLYLEWLSQCQLAVGTFPFSSSASTVDVMRLGIPKVVLVGREHLERVDYVAVSRLSGLDSLLTDSAKSFVARTVALIDNPMERDRLSAHILAQDPSARFLADAEPDEPFKRAVWCAYMHHHGAPNPTDERTPLDPTPAAPPVQAAAPEPGTLIALSATYPAQRTETPVPSASQAAPTSTNGRPKAETLDLVLLDAVEYPGLTSDVGETPAPHPANGQPATPAAQHPSAAAEASPSTTESNPTESNPTEATASSSPAPSEPASPKANTQPAKEAAEVTFEDPVEAADASTSEPNAHQAEGSGPTDMDAMLDATAAEGRPEDAPVPTDAEAGRPEADRSPADEEPVSATPDHKDALTSTDVPTGSEPAAEVAPQETAPAAELIADSPPTTSEADPTADPATTEPAPDASTPVTEVDPNANPHQVAPTENNSEMPPEQASSVASEAPIANTAADAVPAAADAATFDTANADDPTAATSAIDDTRAGEGTVHPETAVDSPSKADPARPAEASVPPEASPAATMDPTPDAAQAQAETAAVQADAASTAFEGCSTAPTDSERANGDGTPETDSVPAQEPAVPSDSTEKPTDPEEDEPTERETDHAAMTTAVEAALATIEPPNHLDGPSASSEATAALSGQDQDSAKVL